MCYPRYQSDNSHALRSFLLVSCSCFSTLFVFLFVAPPFPGSCLRPSRVFATITTPVQAIVVPAVSNHRAL